jgi:heterodisulfide reductase subunit B
VMKGDPDKRYAINNFMDEEPDYAGEVETVHLLQVLRDDVGWDKITAQVKRPLKDLKIAGYYGCTLLRPQSAAIDNIERPTILRNLINTLGSKAVEFPYATECCGAYQVVNNRDIVTERTATILSSAIKSGAEAIVVSCPLCEYNLRQTQKQGGVNPLPTLYFTQLMALAFGLDPAVCGFEENSQETRNWLKSKRLIS